ncbi:MAG: DUF6062 family protein [Oscillospiraceae bacterium]|nr:DUF6062 family protein [Oscillospiraceae bacterium]
MPETIYTIPINAAFDQAAEAERPTCPFCLLAENLLQKELGNLLGEGPAMEPTIRLETNKKGFCRKHNDAILAYRDKNRLTVGLMLETHLDVVRKQVSGGLAALVQPKGAGAEKTIQRQAESCYVCDKTNFHFGKMMNTAAWMYINDDEFRKKRIPAQSMICLPHFARYAAAGREELRKNHFGEFYSTIEKIMLGYFDSLREDVSGYCKMFDYRSDGTEWGNKKDAIERAMNFLTGE